MSETLENITFNVEVSVPNLPTCENCPWIDSYMSGQFKAHTQFYCNLFQKKIDGRKIKQTEKCKECVDHINDVGGVLDFTDNSDEEDYVHVTKTGNRIKLSEMSDRHLLNTINYIKRKTEGGVELVYGFHEPDDVWGDVEYLSQDQAEERMNLDKYIKEAEKRGLLSYDTERSKQ